MQSEIQSRALRPARVRLVIQSRLASSRLPAKAMLTVAGMPLVVLAALRAAESGYDLVVATSTAQLDDHVAEAAQAAGLTVFRGSEDDALSRYVQAVADLDDGDVVVRLTGDNAFPDGALIRRLVNGFLRGDAQYLSTVWPDDGLPYGLSCEAMSVGALRHALASCPDAFDREHVTPWVRRTYGVQSFPDYGGKHDWSHLRVTIDNIDDYARVARAFRDVSDPLLESWEALTGRVAVAQGAPQALVPAQTRGGVRRSRLVVGGAQLGMDYGIANGAGRPSRREAVEVIRTAVAHGVTDIDTARAYGESEACIGAAMAGGRSNDLRAITKLSPLDHLTVDMPGAAIDAVVEASVFHSCRELGLRTLPLLLLHRAAHLTAFGGRIWHRLLALKADGVIGKLGVSLQTPEEGFAALEAPEVTHLQLPCNLLDWRWDAAGFTEALGARSEITVHVRSVFLQGLLAQPMGVVWPKFLGFDSGRLARTLVELAALLGRDGPDDLAVAWVNGLPWVHSLVIGQETLGQLRRNLSLISAPPLTVEEREKVRRALPEVPEILLNPALWPRTEL